MVEIENWHLAVCRLGDDPQEDRWLFTKESNPVALQVSEESRNAVISQYPLCFGSALNKSRIRFNFELDTLYMRSDYLRDFPHFFGILDTSTLESLRYIAIVSLQFIDGRRIDPPFAQVILDRIRTPVIISRRARDKFKNLIPSLKGLQEIITVYNMELALHSRRFEVRGRYIGGATSAHATRYLIEHTPSLKYLAEALGTVIEGGH